MLLYTHGLSIAESEFIYKTSEIIEEIRLLIKNPDIHLSCIR